MIKLIYSTGKHRMHYIFFVTGEGGNRFYNFYKVDTYISFSSNKKYNDIVIYRKPYELDKEDVNKKPIAKMKRPLRHEAVKAIFKY